MRRAVLLALLACVVAGTGASAAPAPKPLGSLGVGHVWVINVENKTFDEAYVSNPNPYLPKQLRAQAVLLRQYFGIGHLSLPNYIAELSGQAPTKLNQSDCQVFMDQKGGVPGPMGQSIGEGCVYPADVQALPNQLTAAGKTWRGYMEDMGNDLARESDRCGEPTNPTGAGFQDGTQSAAADDQYAARHNPFVYFHSILDSPLCHTNVLPLTALADDLKSESTTPAFSFITPNLCDDGHDDPCKGKNVRGTNVGGLVSVDYWLQKYVPLITSSPAFRRNGVLIITSDESESGSAAEATACCNEQPGYNTPLPGITGPGGGRIGTLVLGHCVKAGSTSDVPYNHYSMLRSVEDLLGITTGGSDSKGHLGYAGADGLVPFGTDVFGGSCTAPVTAPVKAPVAAPAPADGPLPRTGGLPLAVLAVLAVAAALPLRRTLRKAR